MFLLPHLFQETEPLRGGQRGTEYPGYGSFRGPALLSNATRIDFGSHVFCIGFGDYRLAQEIFYQYNDRNLQVIEFDLQKKRSPPPNR